RASQSDCGDPRIGEDEMSPTARATLCTAAAVALLGAAFAPADDATKSGSPRAVFMPSKSTPLVALRLLFRVASEHDPKGKEGLAALTASMIAEGGTKELSYDQILEKFYPMAASLSASCHKEATVFSGEVHRDNLAAYKALATSMLTSPRFAPEDFERLRNE